MKAARIFLLLIYVSILIVNVSAQDDDDVIRVDTQIIDVPVVVTDKDGKPILNLKKNNFVIYEDGKSQEITDFSATAAHRPRFRARRRPRPHAPTPADVTAGAGESAPEPVPPECRAVGCAAGLFQRVAERVLRHPPYGSEVA